MNFELAIDKVYESTKKFNQKKDFKTSVDACFTRQELREIKALITEKKEAFVDLFSAFDQRQEVYFSEVNCEEEFKPYVGELFSNGFAKIENVFSEDELAEVKEFQDLSQEKLYPIQGISGYVHFTPGKKFSAHMSKHVYSNWRAIFSKEPTDVRLDQQYPNDGQQRLQSKIFGIHPPGAHTMVKKSILCKIFALYNNLNTWEFDRSNIEFIHPAPINHNSWHRDMVPTQLKAMVLLEDVDEYTAPLLYAVGSHRARKDFDKQHLYDMFVMTLKSRPRDPSSWPANITWPEYALTDSYANHHSGYISHDHAPFDLSPSERMQKHVVINGYEYGLAVGTGKAGDVLVFDSCGLHSGSRAHFKSRRNITITSTTYFSPKSIFFKSLNDI
jgi:hypothetical protein